MLRQTFDWAQIEIARNRYDFSWYDALMADLARRRLGVLPIVFNAPRFRALKRSGSRGAYLPRTQGRLRALCRATRPPLRHARQLLAHPP